MLDAKKESNFCKKTEVKDAFTKLITMIILNNMLLNRDTVNGEWNINLTFFFIIYVSTIMSEGGNYK